MTIAIRLLNILRLECGEQNIIEGVEKLENMIKQFEQTSGEIMGDTMMQGVILRALPPQMQNKLVLQTFATSQDLKQAVVSLCMAMDSQALKPFEEPTAGPMEVGGIKGSFKGRGKGKDKGKSKKGSWQAGDGAEVSSQTAYNACTWCEGFGHWRRDCKARKAFIEQCGTNDGDNPGEVAGIQQEELAEGEIGGIVTAQTDGQPYVF